MFRHVAPPRKGDWKNILILALSAFLLPIAFSGAAEKAHAVNLDGCIDYVTDKYNSAYLVNKCNVRISVRYCCYESKTWGCEGGREKYKGSHQWTKPGGRYTMACDPTKGWRWAGCQMEDAEDADIDPYNWDGRSTRGFDCAPPRAEAAERRSQEMDRSRRQKVQKMLAARGFDPGPADGKFGRRTEAAIRKWQASKSHAATGELTGDQVRELLGEAKHAALKQPKPARDPAIMTEPKCLSGPGQKLIKIKRGGDLSTGRCWYKISNKSKCYVWIYPSHYDILEHTYEKIKLNWSGVCAEGVADGKGNLSSRIGRTLLVDSAGAFVKGKKQNLWISRRNIYGDHANSVSELPYVDGRLHGVAFYWQKFDAASRRMGLKDQVIETPFVHDKMHGIELHRAGGKGSKVRSRRRFENGQDKGSFR